MDTILPPATPATPATPADTGAVTPVDPPTGTPPAADTPANGNVLPAQSEINLREHLNDDGTFMESAYEHGIDKQWKSIGAMQKGYKDLQAYKMARPGEDASPEDIQRYREAVGAPSEGTAESYGIKIPEELAEYIPDESVAAITAVAHKHHVSREAMQDIFAAYNELEQNNLSQMANNELERQTATVNELKSSKEFSGDRFEAAVASASNVTNSMAQQLGIPDDNAELNQLRNNSVAIRMMHRVAAMTSGDSSALGTAGNVDLRSNAEIASDIITNPANPKYERYHSGDPAVQSEVASML